MCLGFAFGVVTWGLWVCVCFVDCVGLFVVLGLGLGCFRLGGFEFALIEGLLCT